MKYVQVLSQASLMFRVTRRPEGLPKCESLAQPLSGSSEVRVTGSAAARSARGSASRAESGRTPGVRRSRAARAPRPARVTPGLSSQSWFTRVICLNMGGAGDEALNSWRHDTTEDIDAGQPARDRRYVATTR